jgi:hypothetical protein
MNQLNTFTFEAIELSEVVHLDGIPHVTRAAIGRWLEYADPQKAIDNILERNPHLETHSVTLKLRAADGKNYDTKVYHPIGFLLIVMESGQPKAHTKKEAVASFVWNFNRQPLAPKERVELLKLRRTLINDLARSRDAFARQALLDDLRGVSLSLGQSLPAEALLGKDPNQIALDV